MSTSYSLIVRYLPEVVPFFKKAAILSEIGWSSPEENEKKTDEQMKAFEELEHDMDHRSDSISPGSQCSQPTADSKSIPLFGAFVRRLYLTKMVASPGNVVKNRTNKYSPDTDCDAVTSDNSFSDSSLLPQEVIVIQSHNLSKACILRFDSEAKCTSWFCAIHKAIARLNLPTIRELNQMQRRACFDDAEVVHMGWFLQIKDIQTLLNEVMRVAFIK